VLCSPTSNVEAISYAAPTRALKYAHRHQRRTLSRRSSQGPETHVDHALQRSRSLSRSLCSASRLVGSLGRSVRRAYNYRQKSDQIAAYAWRTDFVRRSDYALAGVQQGRISKHSLSSSLMPAIRVLTSIRSIHTRPHTLYLERRLARSTLES